MDFERALGWRAARQGLDAAGADDVIDAVRRVVALRAWPADLAELAVAVRQAVPEPGGLRHALSSGAVIRSYAFRGGSYVFTPADAAVLLAVRAATGIWKTRRYQQQGGFALDDWEPLRVAVHDALASGPKTRVEIAEHVMRTPDLRHLAEGLSGAGADSLYKPLHWWGDICFGPSRDGQATFRLLAGDPHWPGLPDADEAGPRAVALYLGAYGPATSTNLTYWFTEGLGVPKRQLFAWLAELGDEVTPVTIDSRETYALTSTLDALQAAEPVGIIRLLPGFDPWIMGPGTADPVLVAPGRRALASRGSNLVTRAGVVSGSWRLRGAEVTVSWFREASPAPVAEVQSEIDRLGRRTGRSLSVTLDHI